MRENGEKSFPVSKISAFCRHAAVRADSALPVHEAIIQILDAAVHAKLPDVTASPLICS